MIHTLALLARAGHGKTTIARHLETKYGVRIVSLASPLKKIAKVVMDFSDRQLYGTQEEKEAIDPRYGISARIFLQKLGTEGLRENIGDLVFCHALRNGIAKDFLFRHAANDNAMTGTPASGPLALEPPPSAVYVVDDARFPNEVDFVNRLDQIDEAPRMVGHTIRINCTDAPPSGNDNHPSEAGIDRVMPYQLAATVVSSRAQGIDHLIGEFEAALETEKLRGLREALRDGRGRYSR